MRVTIPRRPDHGGNQANENNDPIHGDSGQPIMGIQFLCGTFIGNSK
jgi:hypothetical protein